MPSVPLQSRLDAVARQRAVLAVARTLAEQGLVVGARVVRTDDSAVTGRIEIDTSREMPRAVVRRDDDAVIPFDASQWVARQPLAFTPL